MDNSITAITDGTIVLPDRSIRGSLLLRNGRIEAIVPAEQTESGVVAVLATPGTMKRDYTRALIKSFAQACHVRLVGRDAASKLLLLDQIATSPMCSDPTTGWPASEAGTIKRSRPELASVAE